MRKPKLIGRIAVETDPTNAESASYAKAILAMIECELAAGSAHGLR